MDIVERPATGLEYLALATSLLQNARLADPYGGIWEAADMQWWWRRDQHADPAAQTFWMQGGAPVAAAILTDWGGRWNFDVVGGREHVTAQGQTVEDAAWSRGVELFGRLGDAAIETSVREDDEVGRRLAHAAGVDATAERYVTMWMDAGERRPPAALPSGFHLTDRVEDAARPHPMIGRNGPAVEARLRECSLYLPGLDLAVRAPDGDVAAYALFWADPVTGVGLVEPMRTEDAYQGRGIGRHLLAEGLSRLSAAGCRRLKVAHIDGNEAAQRLYEGAGFHATDAVQAFAQRVRLPEPR